MSENPYARGEHESPEPAAPTEQVPVQPAPEPAAWATGSYGSPSTEPPPPSSSSSPSGTGYEGVAAAYGSPYGAPSGTPSASPYGSPYGDPSGRPEVPTPPWGGQQHGQHGQQGQQGQHGQQGQEHGWPFAPGTTGPHQAPRPSGFLASLFDTSFDRFVTPVVAKVAYLVVIVAVGLTWVANLVGALLTDATYALVVLVVGGVLALVTVIGARVLIEAVLALVRLAEDTRTIRDRLGDGGGDVRGR